MIEGILGKKIGMTHIYSEEGAMVPVTVIKAGNFVVQRKTREKEGYDAVQVGFGEKKESRVNKPMKGHFKKAGTPCLYRVMEFKGTELDNYKPGALVNCADVFKVGDFIDVSGESKGKGFMGSMRRHHFSGGAESHGSMHNRAPGSIGSSSDPSRVYKGMRMAGHMGSDNKTVQNLKVVGIRAEENVILVKGAVPGAVNGYVVIKKALKK
ncbi:MAG: 50S ribosomal protein L3 [Deltaproteobacteria bacterium]|nr:50S ribosomal protein L3 [Deltaproteobacteria bacterium]